MHWYTTLTLLVATAEGFVVERAPCDVAQSILSRYHGAAGVSSVCNSVFGTPTVSLTTKTVTVISTQTVSPPKVTNTVTKTKSRVITETGTAYSTIYKKTTFGGTSTVTSTVTAYSFATVTSTYGNANNGKRNVEEARATPDLIINGIAKSILSTACSCLAPSPTSSTITKTITNTVTRGNTQIVQTTITETDTSYAYVYVTRTTIAISTTYSYTTLSPTETFEYTLTSCTGTNPAPSFHMQVSDLSPTRTDKFNSLYATQTQIPVDYADFFSFDTTPNIADSALYNIDCVGRLVSSFPASLNKHEDLFSSITYFQPGFEAILMLNQSGVAIRGWYFVMAEDRGADGIYLHANQVDVGVLDTLETVAEYQDATNGNPIPYVILGNWVPDQPYAVPFRFQKVAAT